MFIQACLGHLLVSSFSANKHPEPSGAGKLLPYRWPFVPCVLSRKGEQWPVLTNPGSLSSSSRLVQSVTQLSHWQSQQYSQIHLRSLCHFVFLIKSSQTQINCHTPKTQHFIIFSIACWLAVCTLCGQSGSATTGL